MVDVVVSIVNTSQRDLTLACLDSLERDRDRRCSVEVVVLDNGSDDGSAKAIKNRHPGVRVIEQPWRAGFGANHNAVIRETSSRYVFVLNEDTEVPSRTLDGLVGYMDAHPEVAVAGPLIRGFDGAQQGSAWRLMTVPVQLTWALTLGKRGAVISHGQVPRRVGAVSACAMLVRREPFEQIGLFDDAYFIYSEEADTSRRLQRLGFERHYVPTSEVLHHGQKATLHVPERQVNETWRSLDLYLSRYHSSLEATTLRILTGAGYGLATIAAEVGRRLPSTVRPAAAHAWDPRVYRLHVRNAFLGTRDPGLRELAESWNMSRGATRSIDGVGPTAD